MSDSRLIKIKTATTIIGLLETGERVHVSLVPDELIRFEYPAEGSFIPKSQKVEILKPVGPYREGRIVAIPIFQAEDWIRKGLAKPAK